MNSACQFQLVSLVINLYNPFCHLCHYFPTKVFMNLLLLWFYLYNYTFVYFQLLLQIEIHELIYNIC